MLLFIVGLISGGCIGFTISSLLLSGKENTKVNKWNPVKKGIPEPEINPLTGDNMKYICTYKRSYDDFRQIGIFWIDDCGRWISQGGYDYSQYVIAWMQMPAIYMGKKRG